MWSKPRALAEAHIAAPVNIEVMGVAGVKE
jgi:hypothetical protein